MDDVLIRFSIAPREHIASLFYKLGRCLNPYVPDADPNRRINPLTEVLFAQAVFALDYVLQSPSSSWTKALQSHCDSLVADVDHLMSGLTSEISSELRNVYTTKFSEVLCGRKYTELLGFMAACSGFNLGVVPGTAVELSATSSSVAERACVLNYPSIDSFERELLNVIPLHENIGEGSQFPVFREMVECSCLSNLPLAMSRHLLHTDKTKLNQFFDIILSLDTFDYRRQPPLDPPTKKKIVLEFESPHPYSDNTDHLFEIAIKGAREMVVSFDPRSSTESNYDYLTFYMDATQNLRWGEEKYSGTTRGCWPGAGEKPPLVIKSGSCFCLFHSDGSNNGKNNRF